MLDIRRIDDTVSVAPQIAPEDMAAIRAAGFTAVVNNRPDGEALDQPNDADVRQAAQAAGLGYVAIPVGHQGVGHEQIDAMASALAGADGPMLAFCRSGTRSCHLWAMARAKSGAEPQALVAAAARAGYDLAGLAPTLEALAGSR